MQFLFSIKMPKYVFKTNLSRKTRQNRFYKSKNETLKILNNVLPRISQTESMNEIPLRDINELDDLNEFYNDEHSKKKDKYDIFENIQKISNLIVINNHPEIVVIVQEFFKKFSIECKLTMDSINILLKFLRFFFPLLPLDSRTLLCSEKKINMKPGEHSQIQKLIDAVNEQKKIIAAEQHKMIAEQHKMIAEHHKMIAEIKTAYERQNQLIAEMNGKITAPVGVQVKNETTVSDCSLEMVLLYNTKDELSKFDSDLGKIDYREKVVCVLIINYLYFLIIISL